MSGTYQISDNSGSYSVSTNADEKYIITEVDWWVYHYIPQSLTLELMNEYTYVTSVLIKGVRIDWAYADDAEYETEVWGKSDSGVYTLLETVPAGTVTYADELDPVDIRYYKLRAKNGDSYSMFAEESVAMLGDELITNGGFDTDTNWGMGSAWDISGGKANYDDSATNALTAVPAVTIKKGKQYLVSYELSGLSAGNADFSFTNTANEYLFSDDYFSISANGVVTAVLTAVADSIAGLRVWGLTSSGSAWSLDNISIKEKLWATIEQQAQRIITINTHQLSTPGEFYGIDVLWPGGGYFGVWLRDFIMSVDGYKDGFSSDYVKNFYLWRAASGVWTDWGELDYVPYLILNAHIYYEKTSDVQFCVDQVDYLKTQLDSVIYSENGLVWTGDGEDRLVGWGMHDVVGISGEMFFMSALAWRAYDQLAEMALVAENTTVYDSCILKRNNLKTQINSTFYMDADDKYYMKASTSQCSDQFDLVGTCFAIYMGIIDTTEANLISNYIISIIDECLYKGGVRHVPYSHEYIPGSEVWEVREDDDYYAYNTFQFGAGWGLPLAWFLYTVNLNNPALATSIFDEAYTENYKRNAPESYSDVHYSRNQNYSLTQCVYPLAKTFTDTTFT